MFLNNLALKLDPGEGTGVVGAYSESDDMAVLDQALSAAPAPEVDAVAEPDAEATDAEALEQAMAEEVEAPVEDAEAKAEPADEPPAEAEAETEAEPEAKVAPADEDDDFDQSNLTIHGLNKKISTSPEFKAALDKDPGLKRQLFFTARRGERADQYDEMFQTPALAKEAKAAADAQYQFKDKYNGEPIDFLRHLAELSVERDEEGRVLLQNGRPVYNDTFNRHMSAYRSEWFKDSITAAREMVRTNQMFGDISGADALEAIRILELLTEGKSSIQADGSAAPEATHQAADPEMERLRQENARLIANQRQEYTKSVEAFKTQTASAASAAIEKSIKDLLAKRLPANSAMSDYMREKVVKDALDEVQDNIKKTAPLQDVLNRAIKNSTRDETGVNKIVQIQLAHAKELTPRILAKVLAKATPAVLKDNAALQNKVKGQINRTEPKTSGGVSTPSRQDVGAVARQLDAESRKTGKPLSDMELLNQSLASRRKK